MRNDFQCDINYTYDTTYCICNEQYCRCSKIINTKIIDINVDNIIRSFISEYKATNIFAYCIDRILKINKVYDKNMFSILVKSGYYGEEIRGVDFSNFEKVIEQIEACKDLSDSEKICYVLTLEYGYLLPHLEKLEFSIQQVLSNECKPGNETYYKKIEKGVYKESKLPLGVYLERNNNYFLVDGYHRYTDLIAPFSNKIINIIVGK